MKATNQEMRFCSLNGESIKTMEGFCVESDISLNEIDVTGAKSIILTGGSIANVKSDKIMELLQEAKSKNVLIGAICAGVDVLEKSGILKEVSSIHSVDLDVVNDKHIITARPNAYVDFAIEVAKELNLFEDEKDIQETIDFWKLHKRI